MSKWEFLLGAGLDGPGCADCGAIEFEGVEPLVKLQLYCGQWRCGECISEIERAEKYGEDTREEFRRRIGR